MKKIGLILLIALLAMPAFALEGAAADEPSDWAQAHVAAAVDGGLVPDRLQSAYTKATTRTEFCALAVRLYETYTGEAITAHEAESLGFDDTEDVDVLKMASIGVVAGIGDGKFAPEALLTREQAATLLGNLANALGQPLPAEAVVFADSRLISDWAVPSVGAVRAAGIMNGVGSDMFAPRDSYTREQSMATMLFLFSRLDPNAPKAKADTRPLYPMSAQTEDGYLWGYVDESGAFVIEPQYAYASEWNGAYGIVSWPNAPDESFVIDRARVRVPIRAISTASFTFPLTFDEEGTPSVSFAGNCILVALAAEGKDCFRLYSAHDGAGVV